VKASQLLWPGTEVYQLRFERSGAALIAVQRALSEEPQSFDGASEFLKLYEWVSRADAGTFTRVWSDPVAYFWVRRAVHFLAASRGEPMGTVERTYCAEVGAESPQDALRVHLSDFKRFVLGIAIVSGQDVTFDELYEASLPLSIPGTRLIVLGAEKSSIRGVSHGAVELMDPRQFIQFSDISRGDDLAEGEPKAGHRGNGVRVEACPVLATADARVFLNPATFNLRGIGIPLKWTRLPLEFQTQHVQLATEALDVIRRFQPETFLRVASALHTIGLKPRDDTFLFNASASELPGAFICTVPPAESYTLASSFIHEFYHNTLFSIEEAGRFLDTTEDDEIEGENHYSPWVETLRPLHGILHAVYVFIPVFHFWGAVVRDGASEAGRLAHAKEWIARIPVQLRMGLNQLKRHAKFTSFGTSIYQQLAREVEAVEADAHALGANLTTPVMGIDAHGKYRQLLHAGDTRPMTVGEILLDHVEKNDLHGECAEEKAGLLGVRT
jgi:hypothetical protein